MVTKKSRAMMKGKDHYPSRRMPIITVWLIVASVVLILLLGGNLVVLSKLLSANERCSVDLKQTAMAPQTMEQQHASVAATFDRNTVMKEYSDSTNGTVSLPKKKSAQASKEKRTIWRASDISFPPSIAVVPNHAVGTYKYNPVRNINAWPKDDEEIELDPALVAKLRIQAQKIDKGRVLDVLIRAHTDIDEKVVDELPTWENVTNMYGSEPVVLGLDTCAAFREKVPPKDRLIAAAGMFNTGTNFFIQLLERNCWIPPGEDEKLTWPRKSGVFWQVRTKFRLSNLAIVRKKKMLMLNFLFIFIFGRFPGVSTTLNRGVVGTQPKMGGIALKIIRIYSPLSSPRIHTLGSQVCAVINT
jgi:hypothetical protein